MGAKAFPLRRDRSLQQSGYGLVDASPPRPAHVRPGRADGGVAPAGTAAPILNALSAAIRRALQTPMVARRFEAMGIDPVGSTPEQHAQQLEADKRFYAHAVRQSGARPD